MTYLTLTLLTIALVQSSTAVSLYEHYAPGGVVTSGLVAEGDTFTLNGKDLTILSGSFHYFRVHPDYWRDTLRKFRAAGLNSVSLYVPWNLHEPRQGEYDFGTLGEDMSPFLDLRTFVQIAQEEDLFVIFRPGPYICAEWDFGGLPSWLLRDYTMHVRSYYENYRLAVNRYYDQLIPVVSDLQFTDGGPIIAVQVENEFGHFGWEDEPRDTLYMEVVRDAILRNGLTSSLLFTSDGTADRRDLGALPGVLQTSNFKRDPDSHLDMLAKLQPNRPRMVAEFWTGWFDHWLADVHQDGNDAEFASTYEYLITNNVSVNMYMFIGGTNFGFMAGANALSQWPYYAPIVSSYDYGAPLSEAGDYSGKYDYVVEILSRLNPLNGIVDNPALPAERVKAAYGTYDITGSMTLQDIVSQAPIKVSSVSGPVNMEALPINNNNGQAHGYIMYSTTTTLAAGTNTLTIRNHVRDVAQVLVDGVLVTEQYSKLNDVNGFGFWNARDGQLNITGTGAPATIDILVENMGRVNFGTPNQLVQKKGLWEGDILIGRDILLNWDITPLEFKSDFVNSLTGWAPYTGPSGVPTAYQATLPAQAIPQDTFLDMRTWGKGCVFINGFNLGRYWSEGPTNTLYIPAPLINNAVDNTIIVFEQYNPADNITFIDYPILGPADG